jgi:hypothetical protein
MKIKLKKMKGYDCWLPKDEDSKIALNHLIGSSSAYGESMSNQIETVNKLAKMHGWEVSYEKS